MGKMGFVRLGKERKLRRAEGSSRLKSQSTGDLISGKVHQAKMGLISKVENALPSTDTLDSPEDCVLPDRGDIVIKGPIFSSSDDAASSFSTLTDGVCNSRSFKRSNTI